MKEQREFVKFIESCYKLYEQKMYQAAYGILHDSGYAEDAVQDAFLKLMKGRIFFEDVKSDDCKRYMITVIKHSSIDIYNKRKKEREVMFFSDDNADREGRSGMFDTQADVDLKELISHLPPKYCAVVKCLAVKELSVREAAQELGITEAAVRKRYERAKLMLKTIQKGCGEYGTGDKIYKSGIS